MKDVTKPSAVTRTDLDGADPGDSTVEAQANTVSRRTIVRGAAWSIPVLAVSTAAPAAAASTPPPCPELGAWSVTSSGPGLVNSTLDPVAPSAQLYPAGTSLLYRSRADSSTPTAYSIITLLSSLEVTAGKTYFLTFSIVGNYASDSEDRSSRQLFRIFVDGTRVFGSSTKANVPEVQIGIVPSSQLDNVSLGQTHTLTYVATATGSVPISLEFHMRRDGGFANDDIAVSPIQVSCD